MTQLKRAGILAIFGISALVLSPSSASAEFLPAFSGNTQMSNSPTSIGIVNFSVYRNNGITGNWVTDLALGGNPPIATALTGGGVIDTSARYVFFYQIVNFNSDTTNPATANLTAFKAASGSSAYTSAGYLSATVFSDGAAVGPSGNRFLGTEGTKPDDVVDGTPSEKGVTSVGFATNASAVAPQSANLGGAGSGGNATFFWNVTVIPVGGWSTIVFLTSNFDPMYGRGDVRDGGDPSDGDIPVQGPVPPTLVLSVIGILGLAGPYGWRRWRSQRNACTA